MADYVQAQRRRLQMIADVPIGTVIGIAITTAIATGIGIAAMIVIIGLVPELVGKALASPIHTPVSVARMSKTPTPRSRPGFHIVSAWLVARLMERAAMKSRSESRFR